MTNCTPVRVDLLLFETMECVIFFYCSCFRVPMRSFDIHVLEYVKLVFGCSRYSMFILSRLYCTLR
jgi:hypothetical protein